MNPKERYFNFPIQLLSNFLSDPNQALDNIVDYAIYGRAIEKTNGNDWAARIIHAAEYFGVTLDDVHKSYSNGKMLHKQLGKGNPISGLSLHLFLNFKNRHKKHFEYICLLAHLAIKSALNSKPYCRMTIQYLLSRMDGRAKIVCLDNLSPEIKKYRTKHHVKKIKNALALDWHLKTYANTRGFYVSHSLSSEALIFEAESRKDKYRLDQLKLEEREAIQKARLRLQNDPKIIRL